MRSLYICYFGLREPLVQTQVLPYLRGLAAEGVGITLLTFEPGGKGSWIEGEQLEARETLARDGIRWTSLRYHRRPTLFATLWDVMAGALKAARLRRSAAIDLFHGRSDVGALMGLVARRLAGGRVVFDIRGLLADEYADAGHWHRGGLLYRLTRAGERVLLKRSDGFVVLTRRAREMLFGEDASRPIEVIPTCIDRRRFAPVDEVPASKLRETLELPADRLIIVYAGALGGWYLADDLVRFVEIARGVDPAVFALVLTQSPPDEMTRLLRRAGLGEGDYRVLRAAPAEIPAWLSASDLGISLIRTAGSKVASSPTKFAEYLAAGLPIVSTAGIGDVDDLIRREGIGVVVESNDDAVLRDAFERGRRLALDSGTRARCRRVAWREFDLESVGIARYRRLYESLLV